MNIENQPMIQKYHTTGHAKMAKYKLQISNDKLQINIKPQNQNSKQILISKSKSPSPFPLPLKRGRGLRRGGWNDLWVLVFGVL